MITEAFKLSDGKISIQGHEICLPYTVSKALSCLGLIIVKIDPPAGRFSNRNIFALSMNGEVCWQIQESPHSTQDDKPYVDISIDSSGALIADNWNGVSYLVNQINGNVTADRFDN